MNDFKKRLGLITGSPSDKWKIEAQNIKENNWLVYSSEIALRILALIEDDEELNQAKLAQTLGVSRQQISKIIKGKENLTLETIYKLSQALKSDLITFPDYKDSYPLGSAHITRPIKWDHSNYSGLGVIKGGSTAAATNTKEEFSKRNKELIA